MIWKKFSLVILIVGLTASPVAVSSQIGEFGANEFKQEAVRSLNEAVTIWEQMYNFAKSFWNRQIDWRLTPVLGRIERWLNDQVTILREAFKKDTEKAGEAIKEEVGQARKSLWQIILEAIGIRG